MIAAVVLDSWKLSIFKKHLDNNEFKYTEHKGLSENSLILRVQTETIAELQPVVQAANDEASNAKKHRRKLH